VLLTAVPSVHLVAAGWGPRWMDGAADRVLLVQAYILASALTGFLVASLAEQVERRRRRAQAALRQAARRALDRADFLAGIGHEMRTPLNAILGVSHLLANGGLPPEERGQAALIERAAERLRALTERALDVNRLRIGRDGPAWEPGAWRSTPRAARTWWRTRGPRRWRWRWATCWPTRWSMRPAAGAWR
jgi:signal transduction histidine kinase